MSMIGWCLALIFGAIALWLANECKKKFNFQREFARDDSGNTLTFVEWNYLGNLKPGMYNVVIMSKTNSVFAMLIGFELVVGKYVGLDPYGFIRSRSDGKVVFSTYLGRGQVKFQFQVRGQAGEEYTVMSGDMTQRLSPQAVYPPHFYQRFGFFS